MFFVNGSGPGPVMLEDEGEAEGTVIVNPPVVGGRLELEATVTLGG